MKATKKTKAILSATTNFTINTSTQTPIEIALQIDENGMTTASKLYSFLELEPKNFSRWCNTNIKNNKFAIENEDYFPFVIEEERFNPKPKTDYKLTSDFAKKLSMTGNTERHEQARDYFIACEQGLKIAAQKIHSTQADLTQITEVLSAMTQSITALTNNMITMQQDIQSIKEESTKKKLPEKKYSRWKTNTFSKLNILLSYVNTHSDENLSLPNIIHLIIAETEDTYDIEVNDYVDAYKSEFDLDTNPYAIDVINHYKDIKDMFTFTLDSILEKLHLTNNTTKSKSKNIFDELAAQLEN